LVSGPLKLNIFLKFKITSRDELTFFQSKNSKKNCFKMKTRKLNDIRLSKPAFSRVSFERQSFWYPIILNPFMYRLLGFSILLSCALFTSCSDVQGMKGRLHGGPTVAMDSMGNYIKVWQDMGAQKGVFAQRFKANGTAQTDILSIGAAPATTQTNPVVASDYEGNFVVVWQQFGQKNNYEGLFAQCFNAAGIAQKPKFQINTYLINHQMNPVVGMDAIGNFVIIWQGATTTVEKEEILGQRFNRAGVAQGNSFRVNTYTHHAQIHPAIAMNRNGQFVVSWQSYGQDGDGYGIFGQRYNDKAVRQGNEFQINTYTDYSQCNPSVAIDALGNFIVVWQSFGQSGAKNSVFGQRYNHQGAADGKAFRVNAEQQGHQLDAQVVTSRNGDYIVAWRGEVLRNQEARIYAQRYTHHGTPQANNEIGNRSGCGVHHLFGAAMDVNGNFVLVGERSGLPKQGQMVYQYTEYYSNEVSKLGFLPNTSLQWAYSHQVRVKD
jgi:hypothetical protein